MLVPHPAVLLTAGLRVLLAAGAVPAGVINRPTIAAGIPMKHTSGVKAS
jgi:hypothetical protein